ncbi:MAG: hypothetical protein IKW96_01605 [Ruminococcus sp.]|uniref:hypothetical protein n=1 Tax=Ruminococcus sp. TaxID=41978 RepID=UPI00345C227F|nr:hypothetical protein [Ruminococcus sp.]
MKKITRFTAALTALCTSVSMAVPMVSHAEEDELAKRLKTIYRMIEANDPDTLLEQWKDKLSLKEASRVFINDLGKVLFEQREANKISFDIKKGADLDDCERIIKSICPDAVIDLNMNTALGDTDVLDGSFYYLFADDISLEDMMSSDISVGQAKKIFEALNDKGYIEGFNYLADTYIGSTLDYLLNFTGYPSDGTDDIFSTLEEFIDETGLDCTVDYSAFDDTDLTSLLFGLTDSIQVTPNYDYDASDLLALSGMIQDGTGLSAPTGAIMGGLDLFSGTEIDMFNALAGDSNCDDAFDLSDAVLIMQALANPNKYSMTAQGRFNADFNDDGITVGDAQAIQNMLLSLG